VTTEATREITINASPSTVFGYLTDQRKLVQWMGTEATIEPVPGGDFRVLCGGVNPSAGEFVEVVPNERVVFTFGWDVPDHPIPAGSTQVEITLTPIGESTLLRLVHRDLPDDATGDHLRGWDYYLGRLVMVCDGSDPGPDGPHLGEEQQESSVVA
jgi:uncharacterized protein YndB with AHSA1/START domain